MDYLIKATARANRVRVYLVATTQIVNTAIGIHDLWPSAASVLGKTLTVGLIMGAMLKGEEALTIKINGGGPIGSVVADSDAYGKIRGYVDHPHVHFASAAGLDDALTLGTNGHLDVVKDLRLKDFYTSTIPLQSGRIAKEFTYYFTVSEQTPSLMSLGVRIGPDNSCIASGGLLIQLLPAATEDDILYLEEKTKDIESMSALIEEHPDLETILTLLFGDDYHILSRQDVAFACNCSKDRFARGIVSLGAEEIQKMIEEDGKAEVICHYCKQQYLYDKADLTDLLRHGGER